MALIGMALAAPIMNSHAAAQDTLNGRKVGDAFRKIAPNDTLSTCHRVVPTEGDILVERRTCEDACNRSKGRFTFANCVIL
ncbi:hypothetical protein ACWIEX_06705 [Bosea sp. NPDC055353]